MQYNIPLDSSRFNKIMLQAWTPVMALLSLFLLGGYIIKIGVSTSDPLSWLGLLVILLSAIGLWLIFPTLIVLFLFRAAKNDPLLKKWYHPWIAMIAIGVALAIIFLANSPMMAGTY